MANNNKKTKDELTLELYVSSIKYVLALVSYLLTVFKAFEVGGISGQLPGIISMFFSFSVFNDAIGMMQSFKKEEYPKGKRNSYYKLCEIYFNLSLVGLVYNWVCYLLDINKAPFVVISMIFAGMYFFKLSVVIIFIQKKLRKM